MRNLTQIEEDKYVLDPEFDEQRRFFVLTRREAGLWSRMSQDERDNLIAKKKEKGEFVDRQFGQTVQDWINASRTEVEEQAP